MGARPASSSNGCRLLLAIFIYSSGAGAIRYNFVPAAAMFAAFGLAGVLGGWR